ncbi:lipoprotein, putative (plasmid) [Aliivibrio fischeri MJ11]|uniref:Lipoprotein, putative n=1 Tax=Aliivibrio fischeri (strain MJ11) TaxID=388396 RepID=B5EVW0_ALIFM|nr:hypothetical protein [Aliivibrio fischeri]ACH64677.1 lipoprotein, putative [Aliivibrio fischeri MJ11]
MKQPQAIESITIPMIAIAGLLAIVVSCYSIFKKRSNSTGKYISN